MHVELTTPKNLSTNKNRTYTNIWHSESTSWHGTAQLLKSYGTYIVKKTCILSTQDINNPLKSDTSRKLPEADKDQGNLHPSGHKYAREHKYSHKEREPWKNKVSDSFFDDLQWKTCSVKSMKTSGGIIFKHD